MFRRRKPMINFDSPNRICLVNMWLCHKTKAYCFRWDYYAIWLAYICCFHFNHYVIFLLRIFKMADGSETLLAVLVKKFMENSCLNCWGFFIEFSPKNVQEGLHNVYWTTPCFWMVHLCCFEAELSENPWVYILCCLFACRS